MTRPHSPSFTRFVPVAAVAAAALMLACSADPAGSAAGGDPATGGVDQGPAGGVTGGGGAAGGVGVPGGGQGGGSGGDPTGGSSTGGDPTGGSSGGATVDAAASADSGGDRDAGPPPTDARPPVPDGEPPLPDAEPRPDRGPPPPNCTDDDLDGYSIGGCTVADCDDQSTEVYPGAPEVCDGLDNDCDGVPDDDYDFTSNVVNCGGCGISCLGRPIPMICVEGECVPTMCAVGTWDIDGDPANGCEYRCTPADDGIERCNAIDDDCDGRVDEDAVTGADPDNCGACGRVCHLPAAQAGCIDDACVVSECDFAWYDVDGDPENGCEYSCLPTLDGREVCDRIDNDCDGAVDEDSDVQTDPTNCGQCGRRCGYPDGLAACRAGECVLAGCTPGHFDLNRNPDDGCEFACVPRDDGREVCNGEDDDCDQLVDEGFDLSSDIENCGACGVRCDGAHATMICDGERPACRVGACEETFWDADGDPENGCEYRCLPTRDGVEYCDLIDNDCDGLVDEAFPTMGQACGPSEGACEPGGLACDAGAIVCAGGVGPVDERCNGQDDDCDGQTDEADPGLGGACGTDVGACVAGRTACVGGALVCGGETAPVPERCNGQDDDCDGQTDEDEPARGFSCPREQWVFGHYDGVPTVFNRGTQYNGTVSCGLTCASRGLRAVGVRFICNLGGSGPTEGCDAQNDGQYGRANCDVWYDFGVRRTLQASPEDCAGGNLVNCIGGSCSEGVTYHAIECQCAP
ncbi:putative metal-binding motif-containing protein [Myxococcota bacterium]|nr:putative metal-binding motif-containing protein [Myxococcota bacterium]